jgi:hypothetical protein
VYFAWTALFNVKALKIYSLVHRLTGMPASIVLLLLLLVVTTPRMVQSGLWLLLVVMMVVVWG